MSRINPGVRHLLLENYKYTCVVCGVTALPKLTKNEQGFVVFNKKGKPTRKTITVDHVVPRSKGGTNRQINLIVLCNHCNDIKADRDPIEWLGTLEKSIQEKLKPQIELSASFHEKILGKELCDRCLEDLSAAYRSKIKMTNSEITVKHEMRNFFIKFLLFFLVIIPLWWFRFFMRITGQWEHFLSKNSIELNVKNNIDNFDRHST